MEASHLKLRSCGGESAVTPKREKNTNYNSNWSVSMEYF